MGNRLGLLLPLASLKQHIQAPTAFQTSFPLFLLLMMMDSGECSQSQLLPTLSNRHPAEHPPRAGNDEPAPNRLTGLL